VFFQQFLYAAFPEVPFTGIISLLNGFDRLELADT
jgi:hypothetical protein